MPQGLLPFQIEGEGERSRTTARAGLLPVLELMVRMGLLRAADTEVGVRSAGGQGFTDGQHLVALCLLNLAGGDGVSDLDVLEGDEGLCEMVRAAEVSGLTGSEKRAFNARFGGARERTFPSESAAFRYLGAFHDAESEKARVEGTAYIPPATAPLAGLVRVNARLLAQVQLRSPQQVATLDQDATLVASDKATAKCSYKGFSGYQPLNTYWAEHELLVHSEFRDGNVPAGHEQLRVLREALACLPDGVQKVRLRSDSAGYQVELLRYCAEGKDERFGVIDFAIAADVTEAFKVSVGAVAADDWNPLYRNEKERKAGVFDQEWAEVCFAPNSLSTRKNGPTYRFLAIRETLRQLDLPGVDERRELPFQTLESDDGRRFKLFGLVTNMTTPGDELVRWHRERCGRSEAAHAIMKDDLAGGRLPSGKFGANAAWWAMMVVSYNLAAVVRRLLLGGSHVHKRMKAIRLAFIDVAGRLVNHAGRTVVRICERHPGFQLIREARLRVMAQAPP